MKPIIEVNNLYKKYRIGEKQRYYSFRDTLVDLAKLPFKQKNKLKKEEFWALKDINFKVMPGEVIGIIGRNGAGKSTLLKILSRITPPTKGDVTLRGRVASLLEVGTGFHPELTGRENIYLNGAILGMKRTEINEKFNEIVEFAEISKFLDTPVKFYSSGMYMRLAFAIAAHLDPEILLVDEVLAVGDVEFQKKCLGKMKEVSQQGRTVLFVSHSMQSIVNLCSKCIYLMDGQIKKIGTTQECVANYFKDMNQDISIKRTASNKYNNKDILTTDIEANYQKSTLLINSTIRSEQNTSGVNVGFSIHDEMGRIMFIIYSCPKRVYSLKGGLNCISVEINDLNLTPGNYTVRTRVEANGIELDWPKEDLAQFRVPISIGMREYREEIFVNGQLVVSGKWK